MITVNVGRTFLKAYNQKYEKELSAKDFFEQEYFELFFNCNKYLNWFTNSEFVQGIMTTNKGKIAVQIKGDVEKVKKFNSIEEANSFSNTIKLIENEELQVKKEKTKNSWFILKTINSIERKQLLANHFNKCKEQSISQDIDYSTAIGYPASITKEFGTTSGLVSDLTLFTSEEEIYLSWIGSGLSVGVAGGLSILFNQPDILLKTFEGWKVYRKFLNDPVLEKLAGNKITSWNGQWLSYAFSNKYRDGFDYGSLDSLGFFKLDKTIVVIETVKWSKLFFNLSRHFPKETHTGYVFSLGQTNKTLGFYPFRFQQAEKLISFYKKLFGENASIKDATYYENMYGIHIKRACELGAIGIQALEPEKLRDYFKPDKMPNLKKIIASRKSGQTDEEFATTLQEAEKKDYENKIIPFRIYKTWLLAMITKNKEEISDYTQEVAKAIYEYRANDKKGSTKRSNIVQNQLFASKSKKAFLEALTEIISEVEENSLNIFKELRDRIHLMNSDDFGYFIVLLKFDYAYQERIL